MDGWTRPNHMPSHLDALQTMRPVNLRRCPGNFHSVAKQASFRVAFRSVFGGFWKPKWMPKPDSRAFFSMLFLNAFFHRVLINFWKLQT